jgi:hypothetical protein
MLLQQIPVETIESSSEFDFEGNLIEESIFLPNSAPIKPQPTSTTSSSTKAIAQDIKKQNNNVLKLEAHEKTNETALSIEFNENDELKINLSLFGQCFSVVINVSIIGYLYRKRKVLFRNSQPSRVNFVNELEMNSISHHSLPENRLDKNESNRNYATADLLMTLDETEIVKKENVSSTPLPFQQSSNVKLDRSLTTKMTVRQSSRSNIFRGSLKESDLFKSN